MLYTVKSTLDTFHLVFLFKVIIKWLSVAWGVDTACIVKVIALLASSLVPASETALAHVPVSPFSSPPFHTPSSSALLPTSEISLPLNAGTS